MTPEPSGSHPWWRLEVLFFENRGDLVLAAGRMLHAAAMLGDAASRAAWDSSGSSRTVFLVLVTGS
ncbi:MAG: hypothetical protein H6522_02910 [Mycolicibacterium sp.]|nr:hypothetical protein [Mycolicibacterium sp.]